MMKKFDEIVKVFFCINNPNIISSFDVLMLVCSTPLCTFLFSKKIYHFVMTLCNPFQHRYVLDILTTSLFITFETKVSKLSSVSHSVLSFSHMFLRGKIIV